MTFVTNEMFMMESNGYIGLSPCFDEYNQYSFAN